MAILVFDIGGTAVKYGVWVNDQLNDLNSFKTPQTWEEMKGQLKTVKEELEIKYSFMGASFSAPGIVNENNKIITGISAIPYIHQFNIYNELEELLELEITMENDANCVALAEIWKGAAIGKEDAILIVIGSGIGGSVIVNKEVRRGKNLFSGEFGYAFLDGYHTFSELGTPVGMANRYEKRVDLPKGSISGEEVFGLAENENDQIAIEETKLFYRSLAKGIHNLAYYFDPEIVLIGGGVSNKPNLISEVYKELDILYGRMPEGYYSLKPRIATCFFKHNANLVGAAYNFLKKYEMV